MCAELRHLNFVLKAIKKKSLKDPNQGRTESDSQLKQIIRVAGCRTSTGGQGEEKGRRKPGEK